MSSIDPLRSSDRLIAVGRIVRPHGVAGTVKAITYSGSGDAFGDASSVFIKTLSGAIAEHGLLEFKPHKNAFLLLLSGVSTVEEAEAYRNAEILVRREDLKRRPDEFFWFELIGLDVYLEDGRLLGALHEIIPTGSNDIYVVKQKTGQPIFVPAIHEVVLEVDIEGGRVIIAPLEGMLEPDEV